MEHQSSSNPPITQKKGNATHFENLQILGVSKNSRAELIHLRQGTQPTWTSGPLFGHAFSPSNFHQELFFGTGTPRDFNRQRGGAW